MKEGTEDRPGQNHKINYLKKKFDTGWLLNEMGGAGVADWTNVHLGNDPTDRTDNLTHNLGAPLRELLIKTFISSDGTDGNAFEVQGVAWRSDTGVIFGITPYQVDNNNIILQTGGGGINYITAGGALSTVDTENWYYYISVKRI